MRRRVRSPPGNLAALFCALGLVIGSGCRRDTDSVRIFAAISLAPALQQAAQLYVAEHPEFQVEFHFGGSAILLEQIRRGAPGDVLISASPHEIDVLEASGMAVGTSRRTLASNELVIVVPAGSTPPVDPAGLRDPRFRRIAVGNPDTAPLGRYTRDALSSLGLYDAVESRLVHAENSRQVLEYVRRGEVRAGVVYRSDLALLDGAAIPGPPLEPGTRSLISYQGVVLDGASGMVPAQAFLDWLAGAPGRHILAQHGFLVPAASRFDG